MVINKVDLNLSADVTEVFAQHVDNYAKGIRNYSKVYASVGVFLGFVAFLPLITKILSKQAFGISIPVTLMVAFLNLIVFGTFGYLAYRVFYKVIHTLLSASAFAKGVFYQRTVASYEVLLHKEVNPYLTTFYFNNKGTISRVKVPNSYGKMFDIGMKVPTLTDIMFYKNSEKVRVVRSCVGSRANTLNEVKSTINSHNLLVESRGVSAPSTNFDKLNGLTGIEGGI